MTNCTRQHLLQHHRHNKEVRVVKILQDGTLRKMSVLDGHVETFLGIPDQTDEYRKDERKAKAEEKRD